MAQDVDKRGGCVLEGARGTWELPEFSTILGEPITYLKNSVLKNVTTEF